MGGEGETLGRVDLRSRGLWYGWGHNSPGLGLPLDGVFCCCAMDDACFDRGGVLGGPK